MAGASELEARLLGVQLKGPKVLPGLAFEPYGQQLRRLDASEEEAARTASGELREPKGPRRDYQDALRVAFLRAEGQADESIAAHLGVPLAFVRACAPPSELPVPRQVPRYVADYGLRCLQGGVEPFRPVELRRAFVQSCSSTADGASTFDALHRSLRWEAAPALRRDYSTGEVTDTGHRLLRERASCGLVLGVPSVDRAVAAIVEDFGIDDPGAYLLCNHYGDGRAFIAPHQHDFWSATFSFGAPRVFLLDERPLVLCDGDVLVFGSQRHSVPKMPGVSRGRISLSLFWHPTWRSDAGYSQEQLARWESQRQADLLWASERARAVEQLSNFGFAEASAVVALNEASDDVNAAAEWLLQERDRPRRAGGRTHHAQRSHERDREQPPQRPQQQPPQQPQRQAGAASEAQPSQQPRGRWRHKRTPPAC